MRIGLLMASALLAVSCDAPDQNSDRIQAPGTTGANNGDMTQSPAEQPVTAATYVMRATMSDLYEIESGRQAMENGNSSTIRDFGRMMVNDHTASSRDLKAAIEESALRVTAPTELDAEHRAMIDRLERAEGAEFDREYMRQQMAAHRKALDLHQQFQQIGEDINLQSFARNVLPVIQKHNDRLEQVGAADTGATNPGS